MRTWQRRMEKAKKGHRPSLKNWAKDSFATNRRKDFRDLRSVTREQQCTSVIFEKYPLQEVEHIDIANVSVEEFRRRFETPNFPCIIRNVPTHARWSAVQNWDLRTLRSNFKDRLFKVGEDDDGYKIKVKLRHFLPYQADNTDDSPLYVFDGNFDNDSVSKSILSDYSVPSLFPDDLFSLVGEKRRPPYRWFLLGPERSGSTLHIDPLATSAWNTLLSGRKRWVLFPPGASRDVVKGKTVQLKGEDDEAVNYFVDHLPRIRERYSHELPIYEFIQEPGETVFVPGGWWHAVLNLEDTVAITQNFCSRVNFDRVWKATRGGRKKMAASWLKRLKKQYPDLAARAEALNRDDGFVMYSSDQSKKNKKDSGDKDKKKDKKNKKLERDGLTTSIIDQSETNSRSSSD